MSSYDTLGYDFTGLIATCVGFFSLSVISEAIKRTRVHLNKLTINHVRKHPKNTIVPNDIVEDVSNTEEEISNAEEENLVVVPDQASDEQRWSIKTKLKLLDGMLFSIQMISSYILMLVVMTFSGWLFLAVVFGQTFGQSVFFYKPIIHKIISHPHHTITANSRENLDLNMVSPPNLEEEGSEEEQEVEDDSITIADVISVQVH